MLIDYKKKLTELVNTVLWIVNDPLGEKYASEKVKTVINDVVMDFSIKTQLVRDEVNVRILKNITEYNIKDFAIAGGKRIPAIITRVGYNGVTSPAMRYRSKFEDDRIGEISETWDMDILDGFRINIYLPGHSGDALPSTVNNMQVLYVAYPTYMDDDTDYIDEMIPAYYHHGICYGVAAMLTENQAVLAQQCAYFDSIYNGWIRTAIMETSRSSTIHESITPM